MQLVIPIQWNQHFQGYPPIGTEYESSLLGTPKIEIWTKHDGQIFLIEYKSDAVVTFGYYIL